MRKMKIIAFSIVMLLASSVFAGSLFGQISISPPGPLTYHIFMPADLGLAGSGKGNKDFRITFGPGAAGPQQITVQVHDDITGDLLVDGVTDPYDYQTEIQGSYFIGELDDNFGGDFDLLDAAGATYDTTLATGRLPRGSYRITVGLLSGDLGSKFIILNVTPPYMQPLYPVDQQTNSAVLDFRWVTNIGRQELRIYSDPAGNKEVLKGLRAPFTNIPDKSSPSLNQQTYRVDGSVVSPFLQDGEIYYWQIDGYIQTTHGDERSESVLTAFQYFVNATSLEYIGLSDADKQKIKDLLIQMLLAIMGDQQGDPGVQAKNSIVNYDINRIVLDNSTATVSEIRSILEAIIGGEATATSIQLR